MLAAGLSGQGMVRMGRGGRWRPGSSASLISRTTSPGSRRICRGEKCSGMMPAAPIRSCRVRVRSQSAGDRCHWRESTSAATPASGHHASGRARNRSPMYSDALYSGAGSRAARMRARRSASAADRIPSATSPGDEAARPGVEQGGHLLLRQVRRPGQAQVHAGQQRLPRAARPDPPPHRGVLHAQAQQLSPAGHRELLVQELTQTVDSHCYWHSTENDT
jgi:hypothetical protein